MKAMPRIFKIMASNVMVFVVIFAATELALSLLLHHPAAIPTPLVQPLSQYYRAFDRKIIQFLPECSQYDPRLFYTLRPGSCQFRNREFDTTVEVNALGVRDDAASLSAPEIVVIGDSHAMGWGVSGEQTFSYIIENKTGQVILNAAVSSYGTARELIMLGRVDTSRLKTLIIQYCDNDYPENDAFMKTGSLSITPEDIYDREIVKHRKEYAYYPGKHTHGLLRLLNRFVKDRIKAWRLPSPPPTPQDEAAAFLHVLTHAGVPLTGVQIIVMEINGWAQNDPSFIHALHLEKQKPQYAAHGLTILEMDLSPQLTPDRYYPLDGHLTSEGHRIVADNLLPAVLSRSGY
jgi:hypothetical protein